MQQLGGKTFILFSFYILFLTFFPIISHTILLHKHTQRIINGCTHACHWILLAYHDAILLRNNLMIIDIIIRNNDDFSCSWTIKMKKIWELMGHSPHLLNFAHFWRTHTILPPNEALDLYRELSSHFRWYIIPHFKSFCFSSCYEFKHLFSSEFFKTHKKHVQKKRASDFNHLMTDISLVFFVVLFVISRVFFVIYSLLTTRQESRHILFKVYL